MLCDTCKYDFRDLSVGHFECMAADEMSEQELDELVDLGCPRNCRLYEKMEDEDPYFEYLMEGEK